MTKFRRYVIPIIGIISLSPKEVVAVTGTVILIETSPIVVDTFSVIAAVVCAIKISDYSRDGGFWRWLASLAITVSVSVGLAPYLAGFLSDQTTGEKPSEALIIAATMFIALTRIWYRIAVKTMVLFRRACND